MIIKIRGLKICTILGIYKHEKKMPRDVFLNIDMHIDGERISRTDALQDTVDYDAIQQRITDYVKNRSFGLIEKLATDLLGLIMMEKKILRATIEIEKPGALSFTKSVSVTLSASRNENQIKKMGENKKNLTA